MSSCFLIHELTRSIAMQNLNAGSMLQDSHRAKFSNRTGLTASAPHTSHLRKLQSDDSNPKNVDTLSALKAPSATCFNCTWHAQF